MSLRDPTTPGIVSPGPRRWPWAQLLRRVFAIQFLVCPRCGGPAADPRDGDGAHAFQRLFAALGLAAKPPPPGSVTAR
jgi:hypothetical protein